jgi:hypothetical protein
LSSFAWAGSNSNPADYTINVRVSTSRMVSESRSSLFVQHLDVVISGKKYELESQIALGMLLALGDYKAKLARDEHKTSYDSLQVYEFLFPDQKTRKFAVVGLTA